MTDAQKLDALILKAQNQDFDFEKSYPLFGEYKGVFSKNTTVMSVDKDGERWYSPWPGLLFNHDFARALFGWEAKNSMEIKAFPASSLADNPNLYLSGNITLADYHLMLAVISDNPVDYMYKAVFGEE